MRLWTVLEAVIGLILFGLFLDLIKPYVPPQLNPALAVFESIYDALTAIIKIIIDEIIEILKILKGLILG